MFIRLATDKNVNFIINEESALFQHGICLTSAPGTQGQNNPLL